MLVSRAVLSGCDAGRPRPSSTVTRPTKTFFLVDVVEGGDSPSLPNKKAKKFQLRPLAILKTTLDTRLDKIADEQQAILQLIVDAQRPTSFETSASRFHPSTVTRSALSTHT